MQLRFIKVLGNGRCLCCCSFTASFYCPHAEVKGKCGSSGWRSDMNRTMQISLKDFKTILVILHLQVQSRETGWGAHIYLVNHSHFKL